MKANFLLTAMNNRVTRIPMGFALAVAIFFDHDAMAIPATVDLGTDSGFAVLAGSGITIAGAVNTTTITGDIGTFPTTSISGLGNVVLNGVNQGGDAVTQNAKNDLVTAFGSAAGRSATMTYSPIFDLGGQTLTPGVYNDPTSFGLTGTLTLDAKGDKNAVFIFQAGTSLTTASHSKINLIGGAQACQVFWEIGSSATLGTGTSFIGTILALTSITLTTGATVDGGLLAQNGAVTLDNNVITTADCRTNTASVPDKGGTLLLLGIGLASLIAFKRRDIFPGLSACQ